MSDHIDPIEDYPLPGVTLTKVKRAARRLNRLIKVYCYDKSNDPEMNQATWRFLWNMAQDLEALEEMKEKDLVSSLHECEGDARVLGT